MTPVFKIIVNDFSLFTITYILFYNPKESKTLCLIDSFFLKTV